MKDLPGSAFVALQHVLPHHFLSSIVYRATRWRAAWWKNLMIAALKRAYTIDLDEATRKTADQFVNFNDFFTRELEDGARSLPDDEHAIACPSDGAISALGRIEGEQIFQAKGQSYTNKALLAGRDDLAANFQNGSFCTIYLAPHNYHRVHAPVSGRLLETIYVPGRLFSVSPLTARKVDQLFARNERLITIWETPAGPMAVILVGAMLVSSMESVWHGEYTHRDRLETACFTAQDIRLDRGAELGRFNMGSTVILLFPPGFELDALVSEQRVKMGQSIGYLPQEED